MPDFYMDGALSSLGEFNANMSDFKQLQACEKVCLPNCEVEMELQLAIYTYI